MTVEQHMLHQVAPETISTSIEVYDPRHRQRLRQNVGRTSLEGFALLEAVDSPWDDMRQQLEERIISQPAAIEAVIEALDGSTVRMPNDKRPIATLAFLGPTGVGKSETARALADFMGTGTNLVKIDCSNFSHGHEVASLTGAPAGYIGYGQEPLLSAERVQGYGTVILFDEIEKGSEPLYNIMLQIMDDGELQLKNGDVTSFRDAVVVMTSNLGAKEMAAQLSSTPLGFACRENSTNEERLDDVAVKSFKEHFRPEFINRLSKMIVFHPLDREGLGQVLDSKLARTNKEYETQLGARVSISDAVREYLIDIAAKELHMGARPLVRALDDEVYSVFGRYWGAEAITEGTHVKVFHQSETNGAVPRDGASLVFASKPDTSLRKQIIVTAPELMEEAPVEYPEEYGEA